MKDGSHGHDLSAAINRLADELSPHKDFFRRMRSEGGRVEFFIGWIFEDGNSGDVFDHSLLARVADLEIDLSFDIYGVDQA